MAEGDRADELLEKALSRTDRTADELDPFWAATWRAAIGMDRYLGRLDLSGQRVLELGCGKWKGGDSGRAAWSERHHDRCSGGRTYGG